IIINVSIAAPPQLKSPAISRYASTTNKMRSVGARTIGVPKSEKLTAKITSAVDNIPEMTTGNVTVKKVRNPFAHILRYASYNDTSLILNDATIGQRA